MPLSIVRPAPTLAELIEDGKLACFIAEQSFSGSQALFGEAEGSRLPHWIPSRLAD